MTLQHRVISHLSCRRCGGASSPTAAFCGSCGAYLTWWGEMVRTEVIDEIADGPTEHDGHRPNAPGPFAPDTLEGLPAAIHPHHIRAPHVAALIARVAEELHLAEHLHRHPDLEPHREQSPESYAEFVADPVPIETTASEPAPMLPATTEHHLHAAAVLVERPDEHGRLCPTCGHGNALHRSYCRHCGTTLAAATGPSPEPEHWWHRYHEARHRRRADRLRLDDDPFSRPRHRLHLPAFKKPKAAEAAADPPASAPTTASPAGATPPARPGAAAVGVAVPPVQAGKHLPVARAHPPDFNALRAGLGRQRLVSRVFPRLGLALTLGAAVGGLTIWREDVGAAMRGALVEMKLLADVEERTVTVQSVSATASVPGRVPAHLSDGSLQTYWAVAAPDLASTTITLTFAAPQKVSAIGFSVGIQNGDAVFGEHPRPHHVVVGFDDGTSATVSLSDTESFQRRDVPDHTTTTLTLRVLDVHPAVNGTGDWVALSEAVVLQRRL